MVSENSLWKKKTFKLLHKYALQLLKQKCNKSRDYCLESKYDLCFSGWRENRKKDMGKLFSSFFSCLDTMALNTVYDWWSIAPPDRKQIPSHLTCCSLRGPRMGTGKGAKESVAMKGHLLGNKIPKSASTLLRASGCQLMHFDRVEGYSLPAVKCGERCKEGKACTLELPPCRIWGWCAICPYLMWGISGNAHHILELEKNQPEG